MAQLGIRSPWKFIPAPSAWGWEQRAGKLHTDGSGISWKGAWRVPGLIQLCCLGYTGIPRPRHPKEPCPAVLPAELPIPARSPGERSSDPKEIPWWEKRWQWESSENGDHSGKHGPEGVTEGWGLLLLFPIHWNQLGNNPAWRVLEIAGRERSRAGQTSNNADVWRLVWDRALVARGELPGSFRALAPGGATPGAPGCSRVSTFFLPLRVFQGFLKEWCSSGEQPHGELDPGAMRQPRSWVTAPVPESPGHIQRELIPQESQAKPRM